MDILAIAAGAFTLAGLVKGVVGFGFPVITLIILTLTIGLLDALAISLGETTSYLRSRCDYPSSHSCRR